MAGPFGVLQARCDSGFVALVDRAATARGMSHSEYVRQAARVALQLDGHDLAAIAPRDAGALYNVIAGQRSYALVSAGRVLVETSRLDDMPDHADANHHPAGYVPAVGDRWLPVEYADSEPFDLASHWRMAPIDKVEADRVVRTFPVVPKSLEAL